MGESEEHQVSQDIAHNGQSYNRHNMQPNIPTMQMFEWLDPWFSPLLLVVSL